MKKNLVNIFIIFLIFQNLLFNMINLPSFFNYWDEGISISIILLYIYNLLFNKSKISKTGIRIIKTTLIIIVIGLLGNICFGYMTNINVIFKDIVGFIKFPITLLLLKELKIDSKLANHTNINFIKVIKTIIIIIFSLGIISLLADIGLSQNEIRYGIKPYQFMFSHPTFLVLASIFLLSFIETIQYKDNREIYVYEFMLLIIIILTMRTKGIAVVGAFIFIKYIWEKIKKLKISTILNKKNILVLIPSIIIILSATYLVYDKVKLYLSFPTSPREELYEGSILLATKCFPLGSGFGTFASHISGKFNSKVYEFIKISYYWTENGLETSVLGDAGFPYYIGQFGLIGIILFGYILFKLYQISIKNIKNKLPIILIWMYVLITLTSESILINNGVELAIMLAYVGALTKRNINENICTRNRGSINEKK